MERTSSTRLSESSRVSEKAMEYYLKFGKDRELEKFMRFRSSSSSEKSNSSKATASSSEEWARVGNLQCLFREMEVNSEEIHKCAEPRQSNVNKEHIVPIEVASDYDEGQQPKTPPREAEGNIPKDQIRTPESVAKSHKRLEWDSLGDVGYRKSKSTSNISIVERMLLREFFEVSTNPIKNANSSENDIRLLEQEISDLGKLKKIFSKTTPSKEESNYSTPPLASSTHIERLQKSKKESIKKPQFETVGTNTSLSKPQIEKYAQTSLRGPEMISQEVQVTLTSPNTSPLLGNSTDPSSFEYCSKRSSNSSEVMSTKFKKLDKRIEAGEMILKEHFLEDVQQQYHNILQVKHQNNAEVCEHLKSLYISWNKVMGENKENISSSSSCSTVSSPPQIDLGIQLICGIMKAKNIENRQKKRLVRNIVKRITKIANSCELDLIVNRTASLIEGAVGANTVMSVDHRAREQTDNNLEGNLKSLQLENMEGKKMSTSGSKTTEVSKPSETQLHEKEPSLTAPKPITKNKKVRNSEDTSTQTEYASEITTEPSSSSSSKTSSEKLVTSRSLPAPPSQFVPSKDLPVPPFNLITSKDFPSETSKPIASRVLPPPPSKPIASRDLPPPPLEPLTSKVLPTPTSKDVGTQFRTKSSTTSTSSTDPPMLDFSICVTKTPSGGELVSTIIQPKDGNAYLTTTSLKTTSSSSSNYLSTDQQKATSAPKEYQTTSNCRSVQPETIAPPPAPKAAVQDWLNPMTQSEVEFEDKKRPPSNVKKHRKTVGRVATSGRHAGLGWIDSEIARLQQLKQYLLHKASPPSGSSKNLPEPLLQNPISSDSSDKLYDTVFSETSQSESPPTTGGLVGAHVEKRDFQNQTDYHATKMQVQFPSSQTQRSKIDTPSGTTLSESVDSFVRQRRQEFLDHYKNQKLNHYDQIMYKYNQSASRASAAAPHYQSDHYSVPLPTHGTYYTYPPKHVSRRDLAQMGPSSLQPVSKKPAEIQCTLSSELSVPMGSYNSLSMPTTTHQYDIATTGVHRLKSNIASQTERSLTRSRPIYETRCMSPYNAILPSSHYVPYPCTDVAKTVCIQARPKGVSYTLQFSSNIPRQDAGYSNIQTEDSIENNVEYQTLDKFAAPSLQLALKNNLPEFETQAKKRKSVLNHLQKLRLERERELRDIADGNTSIRSLDRKLKQLPPPATEQIRLFPTKQMKAMTSKRVAKLPEVLAKEELKREERYKRSNRLLREVFNRRLRERVRKGSLSLNHSHTVI